MRGGLENKPLGTETGSPTDGIIVEGLTGPHCVVGVTCLARVRGPGAVFLRLVRSTGGRGEEALLRVRGAVSRCGTEPTIEGRQGVGIVMLLAFFRVRPLAGGKLENCMYCRVPLSWS